ncbi:hypothetical protein DSO57_1019706 [Entomophthora muscae]|uniref:Uncharacterized protein n=1 Tax=Entomophthora muscae TaxID=34485 RepID=A0ACC2TQV2_9FUNG|nr:hypothetical protein DSO57_1019706 [Entomophthora muscae]
MCEIFPPSRVAIKLTPCGGYNYMGDDSAESLKELYSYLIEELNKREIGYIQLLRYLESFDQAKTANPFNLECFIPLLTKTKLI